MDSILNRVNANPWALFDPASLIAGSAALSISLACLDTLPACLLGLGFSFAILSLARPRLYFVLERFAAVNSFVLFLWLIVPFTTPGAPVWHWGWLKASIPGLQLCLLLTLKANSILAVFLAWLAPLSLSRLAQGLAALHCPAKLTFLILLMERNIFILKREWHNLFNAAKLRGFIAGTNFRSYRTIATLLAILLIRASDRAKKLQEAMLLAGFNGRLPFGQTQKPDKQDYIFICTALFMAFLIFGIDYV